MKIGVWTGFYNDMEIEDAVKHLAEIGWLHIEFSYEHIARATKGEWRKRLEALRDLYQSLGMKAWQLHSPLELNIADFNSNKQCRDLQTALKWVEYCQVLNVPYMVIHPGGSQGYASLKERQRILQLNIDSFKKIAKFAEDRGVKLAVENMLAGEESRGRRFPGEYIVELHELIDAVNSPSIGICFDTSHANALNLDLVEAINECGVLLWATHISDNDGTGDQHRMPYNGKIDWVRVVRALKAVNYPNLFDLEIPGETVPPVFVRDLKLEYAKKMLTRLLNE